jgi:hypothetical protein
MNKIDLMNCPAVQAYKLGKVSALIRKAHRILEEMEMENGNFHAILSYCSEESFIRRQELRNEN